MDAETKQSKGRKITSRLAYSFGRLGTMPSMPLYQLILLCL